jgi:HEAT repeat protein
LIGQIAIAAIGPGAAAAIPLLRVLLGDKDGALRVGAALAVWRAGGDAITGAAVLSATANDDASEVRCSALGALAAMGDATGAGAEAVVTALADADADVRTAAARTAPSFRAAKAAIVPVLMRLLDDQDGYPRWHGIQSLLRLGVIDIRIGDSIEQSKNSGNTLPNR